MGRWFVSKLTKLARYIEDSVKSGRAIAAFLSIFCGLIVVAAFASFFITPKPWIVQFWQSLVGIAAGASVGVFVGLLIGGIGIAVGGTAFGLAGWLVGAIFGATLGGTAGLLFSFIIDPSAYSFDILRFSFVLFLAVLVAAFVWKAALWSFRKLFRK